MTNIIPVTNFTIGKLKELLTMFNNDWVIVKVEINVHGGTVQWAELPEEE